MDIAPPSSQFLTGASHSDDPLLRCCLCGCSSINDPVLLNCLHNCCRNCFKEYAINTPNVESSLKCPLCQTVTVDRDCCRNDFLCNYAGIATLTGDSLQCKSCEADGDHDKAAEYWCVDCCAGLCAHCYEWHNKFNTKHLSEPLHRAHEWPRFSIFPTLRCETHGRPLKSLCFTCKKVRCSGCLTGCNTAAHKWESLSHDSAHRHAKQTVAAVIKSINVLNHILTRLMSTRRATAGHILQATARLCIDVLPPRKQVLLRAADRAYERAELEAKTNINRIQECCSRPWSVLAPSLALPVRYAEFCVNAIVPDLWAIRQSQQLIEALRRCTTEVREAKSRMFDELRRSGSFGIAGSVPLTSDILLDGCFGSVRAGQGPPAAPFLFGREACSKFLLAVGCYDVAVMDDGRLLLATIKQGLLEYSDDGRELSSWLPPKLADGRDDVVTTVEVLSDGRVAVGVRHARTVVLLRCGDNCNGPWHEDGRVEGLLSYPRRICAYRCLMAVAEGEHVSDISETFWTPSFQLAIVRLSNTGELLYRQTRDYAIRCVAITALCVVTSSEFRKKLNSGVSPFVVDAHSHAGEFLWRHESDDSEGAVGICAAATWHRVYVSLWGKDGNSGSVWAIGGADGRELREVIATATFRSELPMELSLSVGRRTQLAVISLGPDGDYVSVYSASG